MVKEVDQPCAEGRSGRFAASHKGIDNSGVFRGVIVTAEKIIFPNAIGRTEFSTALSNLLDNLAESAVHPVAVGRHAYMFCGNHLAAEHAAIMYTLLGCCRQADVNPREWLIDILEKLPYFLRDEKDLKELLPKNWSIE